MQLLHTGNSAAGHLEIVMALIQMGANIETKDQVDSALARMVTREDVPESRPRRCAAGLDAAGAAWHNLDVR